MWYIMIYLLTVIGLTHPVAVVQYTFTHKQYTEQHSETQYLERNIHNIHKLLPPGDNPIAVNKYYYYCNSKNAT